MLPFAILWPTFALVGLIFVVWFMLVHARLSHVRRNPPARETFATAAASNAYFEPVQMPANNLANLFEMPVLYFALVPLLLLTHQAGSAQVLLAWGFVVLRALHSFVHIGPRNVRARSTIYMASVALLLAMWAGFAIDIVRAADAYNAALAAMPR